MSNQVSEHIQLYSIRRLCPFRGTLQVIELSNARALSADGRQWELQIASRQPDTLWGPINSESAQLHYFNFGVWSAQQGLRQVPVNPIMDLSNMLEACSTLIEALKNNHSKVPYPLADHYEYWLLDETMQPMALLSSTNHLKRIDNQVSSVWRATVAAHQHLFNQSAAAPDHPSAAARLESVVQQAAGSQSAGQWFSRNIKGDGIGLSGLVAPELVGRKLSANSFPDLLVREHWHDADKQNLFSEFFTWSAPLLLTLQNLSDERRVHLEKSAAYRPQAVEKFWHTYPKIIDKSLIKRTRVEARLINSTASLQPFQ